VRSLSPGTTGIFTSLARSTRRGLVETAKAAEVNGFSTLWLADVRGDLSYLATALQATEQITLGSAVLSIWDLDAGLAAKAWSDADAVGPDRALLGVGVSHPAAGNKPMERLRTYLDTLDATPVPQSFRIIGANSPKMLALAAERSAGAVTQMVTPKRTAQQRNWLGPEARLATELKVIWGGTRDAARQLGRRNLSHYLGLPTYQRNLTAQGFTADDFADGGSDRLVDALVAGPTIEDIAARIDEQRDAGADHICLHVLSETDGAPLESWREVAGALSLTPRDGARR
jgi:probable F420-dependent oxidoreductase